jgi:hypothetical protein
VATALARTTKRLRVNNMNAVNQETMEIAYATLDLAIEMGRSEEYISGIRSVIYDLENFDEEAGE